MSVRFVNNLVGDVKIDIYLDDVILIRALKQYDSTRYMSHSSEKHIIIAKISKTNIDIAIKNINIEEDINSSTIIILGVMTDLKSITMNIYSDESNCANPGQCQIRFIHGMSLISSVDVYINNIKIFSDIKYLKTGSPTYLSIPVGKMSDNSIYYTLSVKLNNSSLPLFSKKQYYVSGGNYTIIAFNQSKAITSHDNSEKEDVTQNNFDINSFVGQWYQIAGNSNIYPKTEVLYTLLQNQLSILYINKNKEGEKIKEDEIISTPVQGWNFPIFKKITIEPQDTIIIHTTDYKNHAILGSATRKHLSILSRNKKMSIKEYTQILKLVSDLGYDIQSVKNNYHSLTKKE